MDDYFACSMIAIMRRDDRVGSVAKFYNKLKDLSNKIYPIDDILNVFKVPIVKYVILSVEVEITCCSLCRTESIFVVFDRKSNIACRSMQSKHIIVEGVDKVEID